MSIDLNVVSIGIDAGIALVELAAKIGPGIIAAIQSNGSYTPEQKAALIARVRAAGNYVPRDLDAERKTLLTARQAWGIDRANGRRLDEPMPPAEPGDAAVPDPDPTPNHRGG